MQLLPQSLSLAQLHGRWTDKEELLALREAVRKESPLLHSHHPIEEVWASLGEEAQDRLRMGFDAARWERVDAFPLARKSEARVGRLKGYGNAIVAPQAIAFIESYLEVERDELSNLTTNSVDSPQILQYYIPTMSLEKQLERLNDNLERYLDTLAKSPCAVESPPVVITEVEVPAPVKEPKPAKKAEKPKKAEVKAEEPEAEEASDEKIEGFDRNKILTGIVEFIKDSIKGTVNPEDRKEVQVKVTKVREKYGVELVGDLADDQLEGFDRDIRKALS